MDDRLQHIVQDSMSARVLRQVSLMKRRRRKDTVTIKETPEMEERKENPVTEEKKEDEVKEIEEEVKEMEEEVKEELREEKAKENLVSSPRSLSIRDREKILRLVLLILIPDLRKYQ